MFFCCCCNWTFFLGGGGGGGRLGGIEEVEQHPLHLFVFFFFPSIRSAKIAICLHPVFVNLGQWKIVIKKTIQDLSNEFLVQFLFKNLTILLEGIQVIKFNCGLLLDSRDTNTSSFCRLPASNLGCGRWGSSNLFFHKFNIPCTMLSWLSLCHSQLL